MRRLACALILAWFAAGACSLHGQGSVASSARIAATPAGTPLAPASGPLDAEVAMPAGFPPDFPIYPRARLTAGAAFASQGEIAFGMEWETLDGPARVMAYYQKQFSAGDWTMTTPRSSSDGSWTATIGRKSDSRIQGLLAVNSDSGVNRILLSLVYPG